MNFKPKLLTIMTAMALLTFGGGSFFLSPVEATAAPTVYVSLVDQSPFETLPPLETGVHVVEDI